MMCSARAISFDRVSATATTTDAERVEASLSTAAAAAAAAAASGGVCAQQQMIRFWW